MNVYERPTGEPLRNTNEGGQLRILRITDGYAWVQDVDDYGHISTIHVNTLYAGSHKNMNRFYEFLGHQVRLGYGECDKRRYPYKRWKRHLLDKSVEKHITCYQEYILAMVRGEVPKD